MSFQMSENSGMEVLNQIEHAAQSGLKPEVLVKPKGLSAKWLQGFTLRSDLDAKVDLTDVSLTASEKAKASSASWPNLLILAGSLAVAVWLLL